jgi:thioredoxin-like negative regulator of GroEL
MRTRRLLAIVIAAFTASAPAATPASKSVLPWVEDDFSGALAEARAKKVPIFVDLWAPWCHTCRSMREFVFTDPALAKYAGRLVWLSIDTENGKNAPFVKRYPIQAWPSFYVIDPGSEKVVLRWVGGATVGQLEKIFADGLAAVGGGGVRSGAALAKADALYSDGNYEDAAAAYREALPLLPAGSPQYARAAESLLYCFQTLRDDSACVLLARQELSHLRKTPSAANLAGTGLDCALRLPPNAPDRAETMAAFESQARSVLADKSLKLAADDRSALYGSLYEAREDAKDAAGAHEIAVAWVASLDGEAARVTSPAQRTALDPNRLNAFDAAGQIEKAIPMLDRSQKDFPDDYNPPARLALVYLKLKQYPAALAASDRALLLVYGPRKLRVLAVRADIYKEMGDAAALRKTVEDALAFAEALPQGQRSETTVASLKKQLEGTTQ